MKQQFYRLRKKILKSKDIIKVRDFGAGSKILARETRKVSRIAKISSIKRKNALLLIRLSQYFDFKNCLEIGTSLGLGTSCIRMGAPGAKIISLEGCNNIVKIAKKQFIELGFKNIQIKIGEFSKTLQKVLKNKKYDLIYFDGNHTKKATLTYFRQALQSIHNKTIFIFDDIYLNPEMEEAWTEIKKHPKVKITIDIFYWGIVSFRKKQKKEHFTVRI